MEFILYVIVAGAVAACWASYLLRDGKHDLEGLRHPLVLLRRVQEQRPGARGVIRTMLGGVSDASVFAFNLWVGSILAGPALAVGGLVAAIRSAGSGQRVLGVLMLSTGVLVTYVVGGVLLRRGSRHLT